MDFRPSLHLSDFATTQFYTSHDENDDGGALEKYLSAPEIDDVPWRAIYDELPKLQPLKAVKLGKCLHKVVAAAHERLQAEAAAEEEDGPSDGRCETILGLAFFFGCHLLKATSSWTIKSEAGAGRRTSKDTSLLSAAWQLRRDNLRSLCELHSTEYFCDSGDAARLLFSTCIDLLTSALPTDAATKPIAETARGTLTEHLAGLLVGSHSAAADALDALLRLAGQSKQKESVIADVAKILKLAMQRNSLAGCSAVAALVRRITGLPPSSSSASVTEGSPESLASLVAALATGPESLPELRASVLSHPAPLLALLNHPKPGVRRPALDVLTSLISHPPSGPDRGDWQELGLAAAMAGLWDRDANLRAKALAIFESKLPDVLEAWQVEDSEVPEPEGRANNHPCNDFCCELAARLLDRSLLVRKRAAALTAALAAAAQPPAVLVHGLAAKVVPVLQELMRLPPDSKLACPEGTAMQLATALVVFAEPASSLDGALSLLRLLSVASTSEEVKVLLKRALVSACLPSNAAAPSILLELLGGQRCSRSDVEQLRCTLQAACRRPALKELMARRLDELVTQASFAATQGEIAELLPLARAMYVLFSAEKDREFLEPRCRWMLAFAQRLGGSLQQQGASVRPTLEALQYAIDTSKLGLQQLKLSEDAVQPLAVGVVALVEGLCTNAPVAQLELHAALSLLKSMDAGHTVLSELLTSLAARSGVLGVAGNEHSRSSPLAGFLAVLAAMAGYYEEERVKFISSVQVGAECAAAGGAQDEEMADAPGRDGPSADCLRAEDDRSARDEAGRRFLEELLAAEDSAPACFVPALLEIAAAVEQPPKARASALRALQGMAMLSQPLCQRCIDVVCSILSQPQQPPATNATAAVIVAAVDLLQAAIDSFPTVFAPFLPLLKPFLATEEFGSSSAAAAAAFAKLMLANKLKNHEFMGLMGAGLANNDNAVSSMLKHVLARLLATSYPAERPSFVLAVVHQTSGCLSRVAATTAALGACTEADRCSDDLVAACAASALDASSLEVAEALLRPLLPSAKVLRSLRPNIEASISTISPEIKRELCDFVSRAEVRTAEAEQPDGGGGAKKRGRGAKTSDAEVQKELLQLLRTAHKPHRGRRHQQDDRTPHRAEPLEFLR